MARHLAAYFVVCGLLAVVNLLFTPESAWSLLPIIGWSPLVTLHAAHAMGLFDVFRKR